VGLGVVGLGNRSLRVHLRFVQLSKQRLFRYTAFIGSVLVMGTRHVFCDVRNEFLCTNYIKLIFEGVREGHAIAQVVSVEARIQSGIRSGRSP
jgi:uncharacterized protein YpiB (UPF0302 family)